MIVESTNWIKLNTMVIDPRNEITPVKHDTFEIKESEKVYCGRSFDEFFNGKKIEFLIEKEAAHDLKDQIEHLLGLCNGYCPYCH